MSKSSDKEMRLHEGELNVMELLWSNKVLAAKDISKIIKAVSYTHLTLPTILLV